MSVIATAVKHLIAAGVTGDALVAAIAEMEDTLPPPVPAGPTKGALRTRAWRERHAASQSVTGDVCASQASQSVTDPAPSPPPLSFPQTPKLTPPPHPHPEGIHADARGRLLLIVLDLIIAGCRAAQPKAKPRWPRDMPPPAGVSDDQWAGFVDHRRAKRETLTPRAYELLCGKLAAHADDEWPPGRIIDQIVERRWTSFEPDWLPRKTETRNGQRPHTDRPKARGLLGAVFDAEHEERAGSSVRA